MKFFVLRLMSQMHAKKHACIRDNVGFSHAHSIGILYSYHAPAYHDAVQRFIRAIKNLDKNVAVACYTTPKDRAHPSSHLLYAFDQQEVSLLGTVGNHRLKKFINAPFDYLFHVDLTSNAILDWILTQSQAKCRVGCFARARKHLFEVMVKVDQSNTIENIKKLTEQILHYAERMEC